MKSSFLMSIPDTEEIVPRDSLYHNEAYHMCYIASFQNLSDEEVIKWLGHDEMLYRKVPIGVNDFIRLVNMTKRRDDGFVGIRGIELIRNGTGTISSITKDLNLET